MFGIVERRFGLSLLWTPAPTNSVNLTSLRPSPVWVLSDVFSGVGADCFLKDFLQFNYFQQLKQLKHQNFLRFNYFQQLKYTISNTSIIIPLIA